jgi:hypothetical protein
VAQIEASSTIHVRIAAAVGVVISAAANASGNIGVSWTATYNADMIVAQGAMNAQAAGALSLVKPWELVVAVDVAATGRCLPPGHREQLVFRWPVLPLPPPTLVEKVTVAVFRSATVATSLLGSPVGAMTTTAMVSIASLESCTFSDVDPLDSAVSPIQAAIGPELGQYYRGASVVGLAAYAGGIAVFNAGAALLSRLGKTERSHDACMAVLRFPSVGMVVVGLAGQGLASCGVSLLRLHSSSWDLILGASSLGACVCVAAWALYVTTGSRLRVRLAPSDFDAQLRELPSLIRPLARQSGWKLHYVDTSDNNFKRRHMMLIDGLLHPWWTGVELSSATLQGAILGIRVSSPTVCRAQQWVVLVQIAVMVAAALYVRPFGAPLPNVFLVLSKAFAFVVAVLVVIDEDLEAAAEVVTAVATGVGACEVLVIIVVLLCSLAPQLARTASQFLFHRLAGSERPAAVQLEDLFINSDDGAVDKLSPNHLAQPNMPVATVAAVAVPSAADAPEDTHRRSLRWQIVMWSLLSLLTRAADPATPSGKPQLQAVIEAACFHRLALTNRELCLSPARVDAISAPTLSPPPLAES